MTITFLDIFDQLRFMTGAITAEWIFVIYVASKKNAFWRRTLIGYIGCCLWAFSYFPWEYICQNVIPGDVFPMMLINLWWLLSSLLSIIFLSFCFNISGCNLWFRGSMGLALQEIITVFCQYCINRLWFPALSEKNVIIYVITVIFSYIVFEFLAYIFVARRMQDTGRTVISNNKKNIAIFIVIVGILSLSTNFTSGIFEWSSGDQRASLGTTEYLNRVVIPYYCVFVLLLICIIIILNQYGTYEILQQKQENEILRQLEKEKAWQYEFSKDNIDLINQKCHDLKYQINALKLAEGSARETMFEDIGKAVQFYDAVIRTNNQVLDTILTEKSLICSKYDIRLSCNIKSKYLDKMEVIDLYTMLGNALDNAIGCVKKYEDRQKRVISLSIKEKEQMLHFFIDNYFEGELEIREGFPVSTKKDKRYHGFGIKSINMLAKRYGGDSRVSIKNNTFSLHVMIPKE